MIRAQAQEKIDIPIGDKPSILSEYCVVISESGGFIKYVSSDPIHAARFKTQWSGTLYKIKAYTVDEAKNAALQAWQSGNRGRVV